MSLNSTLCFRCVDGILVKNDKTKLGNQRYICKKCNKTRVTNYVYNAYDLNTNQNIILLTKEGLGIRSTSRVLGISTTTVLKRIVKIAHDIKKPIISIGKTYEVDEMRIFIKRKSKLIWIVYAL